MRPVGDCNLADYYDKVVNNPDALSILRGFFGCLSNAVRYLHSLRIRHADIKPQNIIVKGDQVRLTDFGIAYHWGNLTRATTTANTGMTEVYAAPEVVHKEPRNTQADIWSLGCVFLEMATVLKGETVDNLRAFFRERRDDHHFYTNRENVPLWIDHLRKIGSPVDNVALEWAGKMLQRVPAARPTAAELLEETVAESIRSGILFCDPCCCDDADSTTDEEEEDDGEIVG